MPEIDRPDPTVQDDVPEAVELCQVGFGWVVSQVDQANEAGAGVMTDLGPCGKGVWERRLDQTTLRCRVLGMTLDHN